MTNVFWDALSHALTTTKAVQPDEGGRINHREVLKERAGLFHHTTQNNACLVHEASTSRVSILGYHNFKILAHCNDGCHSSQNGRHCSLWSLQNPGVPVLGAHRTQARGEGPVLSSVKDDRPYQPWRPATDHGYSSPAGGFKKDNIP